MMAFLWKQQSKSSMSLFFNGLTSHSTGSRTNGNAATSDQNKSVKYRFPLVVLQDAANNFDKNWVIGEGGFGKVNKGVLRDGTTVAVKRGHPISLHVFDEFSTEIGLLPRLRHDHLVSLVGYCDERNEMILVYEYMEKGTLRNHLYDSNLPSLIAGNRGWKFLSDQPEDFTTFTLVLPRLSSTVMLNLQIFYSMGISWLRLRTLGFQGLDQTRTRFILVLQ